MTSLALKNILWPTVYAPRRKNEPEVWTRGRVAWACSALRDLARIATQAKNSGNLPIAAYIPVPYESEDRSLNPLDEPVYGIDTRKKSGHPLRHAVLAAVRALADRRAIPATFSTSTSPDVGASDPHGSTTPGTKNGSHYLLTSLTAFVTHEPCIMCSMALLHSRVKEVIFLSSSPGTGGCGGAACVPALEGVNHRFGILKWKAENGMWKEWWEKVGLDIPVGTDA
jgi:tRNA-specific adenosine deaminase 3